MSAWPTTIVQSDIDKYAELSGDNNPMHVDPEFARTTPYGSTIAHGPITAALIARYLAQDMGFAHRLKRLSLKFITAVRAGDQLSCEATPATDAGQSGDMVYDVRCRNQKDETVSAGHAVIAAGPRR